MIRQPAGQSRRLQVAMLLKPVAFIAIVLAGWGLGRTRPAVNMLWLVLAIFAAVTAHSGMQTAFFENRLDVAVGDPRAGANAGVVVLIAAGEAVGLWVPFVVLPWARLGARLWAGLFMLAAATAAAATFYFPFDGPSFDGEIIGPFGPPYLLAPFVLLPVAGVGFFMGWLKSFNEEAGGGGDE